MSTDVSKQVAGLRRLYRENDVARRLMDLFAERQRESYETAADTVTRAIRCEAAEALDLFRKLGKLEVGVLKLGRRGNATRMVWNYRLSSMGMCAQSKEDVLVGFDNDEATGGAAIENIRHSFQLRPDLNVTFQLPSDITAREAERLAGLIRQIPFE